VGKCFAGCWRRIKSLRKKRKMAGVVNGLDLMLGNDPLRAEMAPYTGDYFQYLQTELSKNRSKNCKWCNVLNKYIR
jgi:hypothetical protein